jgi:hypothetical protein
MVVLAGSGSDWSEELAAAPSLLVDLDVHPREVMQILRHAQIAVTMEVYAQASSKARLAGGSQP